MAKIIKAWLKAWYKHELKFSLPSAICIMFYLHTVNVQWMPNIVSLVVRACFHYVGPQMCSHAFFQLGQIFGKAELVLFQGFVSLCILLNSIPHQTQSEQDDNVTCSGGCGLPSLWASFFFFFFAKVRRDPVADFRDSPLYLHWVFPGHHTDVGTIIFYTARRLRSVLPGEIVFWCSAHFSASVVSSFLRSWISM